MGMRYTLLLFAFCFAGMWPTLAQNGVSFPDLPGEFLSGEKAVLPDAPREKMLLVGMAYSKKAEDDLRSWYQPMYDSFVLKRGIMDSMYNIDLCFVPMFTGIKQTVYDKAMKELRSENRSDLHPHILFYKGDVKPYIEQLKMDDKTLPYFFLIGKQGKVVFSTSGSYSERKKEQLEEALDGSLD